MTASAVGTELNVRQLGGCLGAEITGVSLKEPLDASTLGQLSQLLLQHKVLFFPGQHLDDDQHCRFAANWGELEVHPYLMHPNGNELLVELSSESGGVADEWHTDVTFLQEPSKMSVLRTIASPPFGGDTMWSNQEAAYEALSEPIRELLDGLTAIHAATAFKDAKQAVEHPVVRVHPETGRKGLFVNRLWTTRIVQLSHADSTMLLNYLYDHSVLPEFTVRYHWTVGAVAMWDNRCTQHYVLNDFEGLRVIRRATVLGDTPVGPGARWATHTPRRTVGAAAKKDRVR
jgi:taurine dioxygenase